MTAECPVCKEPHRDRVCAPGALYRRINDLERELAVAWDKGYLSANHLLVMKYIRRGQGLPEIPHNNPNRKGK